MKSSKSQTHAKFHKIPNLRFDDQQLTSFSGLIVFHPLFRMIELKRRLKECFGHLKSSSIYGVHTIVMILIVHLLLGFRRLRDVEYYGDDPVVLRLLGLRKAPSAATISRNLSEVDEQGAENLRRLSHTMVVEGLLREGFSRLTLDFDGSVQSTKRHAEGASVGYNKKKKGSRSYYPLFCTVAQTGQFFDVLHRPGNVHDSNGAKDFMKRCFDAARTQFRDTVLEARTDSAFYGDKIVTTLDELGVLFSMSAPFERLPGLKEIVEKRKRWRRIDGTTSFFEVEWKPKKWDRTFRHVCVRTKRKVQRKGPLQLDLFEPVDFVQRHFPSRARRAFVRSFDPSR